MSKTYLESNEIAMMEQAADNVRDRILVRLLFRLGCRISEALAISVNDIDFSRGTVTIQHLKQRLNLSCPDCRCRLSKSSRFCPACGTTVEKMVAEEKQHRRQRTIPLDGETLTIIRDFIDRGGTVRVDNRQVLFGITRHQAWRIVKTCAERARISHLVNPETGKARGISPHRLRDAFAIHAVKTNDSGDGLRLLQEHLGHQSITTTMKYRKISGEEQKEWYQNLWSQNGASAHSGE